MGVSGFQDVWLSGSRFYYQRDPVGSVSFPTIDLGIIQPAAPNFDIEKVELEDSDGGVKQLFAEAVVKITEEFTITCSNMNMENLAVLFLANRPESYAQGVTQATVTHYAEPGSLVKILDASGEGVFMLNTVDTVVFSGGTSLTGFEVVSLDRGIIRILDDTTNNSEMGSGGNVDITYTPKAITGNRLIKPQQLQGTVTGKGWLIFGRGNNADQTAREGSMSLTPSGGTISVDDYSNMELTLKFLSDLTLADPAGRLLHFKGSVPAKS